jgi:hypothetical protein
MTKQIDPAKGLDGQAGAQIELASNFLAGDGLGIKTGGNRKIFKAIKRLEDELCQINQRWNDFRASEKLPMWERYLGGHVDLHILGQPMGCVGSYNSKWLARIVANRPVDHDASESGRLNFCAGNLSNASSNGRHDEIVLIDLVRLAERPEIRVPVTVSFYRVLEESLDVGIGEGRLYLSNAGGLGGYKVLPFLVEGKSNETSVFSGSSHDCRGRVIKGRSKVVYRVPDHAGEDLWNRAFGKKGQLHDLTIWISGEGCITRSTRAAHSPDPGDLCEAGRQGLAHSHNFIDVCIGPISF